MTLTLSNPTFLTAWRQRRRARREAINAPAVAKQAGSKVGLGLLFLGLVGVSYLLGTLAVWWSF